MKSLAYASLLILALSACALQPKQTLSQKLERKTPEEKQEVLRLECLNEAEYSTDQKKVRYQRRYGSKRMAFVRDTDETARLKRLCREMTETLERSLHDKGPAEQRAILAEDCGHEIQKGLKPENPASVGHFERMRQICEEMTGKPVVVKDNK